MNKATTNINPKLEAQLNILDKKLNDLLREVKVYSEDQLNRKPKEDAWSVIQTMHHLMMSENGSLKYVKKKLSFNPELKNAGAKATLREMGLNTYLNSPFKWKAPEGISGDNLPKHETFWKTAQKWKSQRLELREYLETFPDELLKKEIYKHPFVGRITIPGMLRFFDRHFNRHHKQIRKIIKHYYI